MRMELKEISKYVTDLLELAAVSRDGAEQNLYEALYHMLTAVAVFEQMTDEERKLTIALKKKLEYFFSVSFSLKERKRRKEKEKFPPNPLIKEKAKQENREKPRVRVCDAREDFRKECLGFASQYDHQLLADFYYYWSEEDEQGRMRFQDVRFWNTEKRLKRWVQNQYSNEITAAAIRLKRHRRQQAKEQTAKEQQQQAADIRQQQDAQREQAMAESRQESMTTADYVARNPDGLMARIARQREAEEAAKSNTKKK